MAQTMPRRERSEEQASASASGRNGQDIARVTLERVEKEDGAEVYVEGRGL